MQVQNPAATAISMTAETSSPAQNFDFISAASNAFNEFMSLINIEISLDNKKLFNELTAFLRKGLLPDNSISPAVFGCAEYTSLTLCDSCIELTRYLSNIDQTETQRRIHGVELLCREQLWTEALCLLFPLMEGFARNHAYSDQHIWGVNGLNEYRAYLEKSLYTDASAFVSSDGIIHSLSHIVFLAAGAMFCQVEDIPSQIGRRKRAFRFIPNRNEVMHGMKHEYLEEHVTNTLVIAKLFMILTDISIYMQGSRPGLNKDKKLPKGPRGNMPRTLIARMREQKVI